MSDSEATDRGDKPSKSSSGGGNFLAHKVGPLPVYGWVVVIVVGYLVYRHYQNNGGSLFGSSSNTGSSTTPSAAPTTPDTTTTATQTATSNLSWEIKMRQALISIGYSPQLVNQSLEAYLSGGRLNATEEGVIHAGVNLVGNAPVSGNFGHYVPPPKKPVTHVPPPTHPGHV